MMQNESLRNEFEEQPLELSDQEIWERIYGRNTKPFDWRKSNNESGISLSLIANWCY